MSLFESASLVVTPNGTKASKLYAIKPTDGSGDLSVVRATTATRVNSEGLIESVATNVPRLDYTNGSCPSILVEPQRTNLVTYSEQFDNAVYINTENTTVSANIGTSPDGFLNADKLIPQATSNYHRIVRNFTGIALTPHSFSIFVKRDGYDFFLIRVSDGANNNISFDLVNGIVTFVASGFTAFIESYENDWFRIGFIRTFSSVNPSIFLRSQPTSTTDNNILTFTGDSTSGAFIWGAQLESSSYATSYIPTTTASVTRNADVISKTGISSLIGQTEGTLFIHFNKNYSAASERYIALGDGTTSNRIMIIGGTSGSIRGFISNGAAIQFDVSTGTAIGNYKIALSYKNNDIAFYINGVQISLDNLATIPSTSNLYLGSHETGLSEYLNGFINLAAIWKTRLTNSELATLTTL